MNGAPVMVAGKGGKRAAAIAAAAAPMGADEVEAVLRLGPGERFGRLVAMSPEEMLGFRQAVKGKDRVRLMAGLSPEQREAVEAMVESPERVIATEAMETRLMRDIDSQAAAAGGDDGVLAEPLQCVYPQE